MNLSAAALWAYRGAGYVAAPLAGPHLSKRAARGKEDQARMAEKQGYASRTKDDFSNLSGQGPIWLHAVSVGESVAALALAERIIGDGFNIVMTTATPASAARVEASSLPLIHQYAPLDAPPFVKRFLSHWQPKAALFTEAEVWPTTLHALHAARVPHAHINARISERAFRRWSKLPFAKPIFRLVGTALAQSTPDGERLSALGVGDVTVTGNLKFDAPLVPVDDAAVSALQAAIATRPFWLAASIHPGEVDAVLNTHQTLKTRWPELLTLVAPRHSETADLVEEKAATDGLSVSRRGHGALPTGDIYLVDTLGELQTFYTVSPFAFVGGSLVDLKGHNPAEPAACQCAIITGKSVGPMHQPFLEAGAATLVTDEAGLIEAVANHLSAPEHATRQAAQAASVLAQERGALNRTYDALGPLLYEASRRS
ncbi:MAG: 3-deoxy-D-manno-octulosonic acid transferase [Pseudomonadota bacterium]